VNTYLAWLLACASAALF